MAVLKLNKILNHSFDIFVPKIKLNHYNSRSICSRSNPILRNLIKLKKQGHKNINLQILIQFTYFVLIYQVTVQIVFSSSCKSFVKN